MNDDAANYLREKQYELNLQKDKRLQVNVFGVVLWGFIRVRVGAVRS